MPSMSVKGCYLTDPDQAVEFVEEQGWIPLL